MIIATVFILKLCHIFLFVFTLSRLEDYYIQNMNFIKDQILLCQIFCFCWHASTIEFCIWFYFKKNVKSNTSLSISPLSSYIRGTIENVEIWAKTKVFPFIEGQCRNNLVPISVRQKAQKVILSFSFFEFGLILKFKSNL